MRAWGDLFFIRDLQWGIEIGGNYAFRGFPSNETSQPVDFIFWVSLDQEVSVLNSDSINMVVSFPFVERSWLCKQFAQVTLIDTDIDRFYPVFQ